MKNIFLALLTAAFLAISPTLHAFAGEDYYESSPECDYSAMAKNAINEINIAKDDEEFSDYDFYYLMSRECDNSKMIAEMLKMGVDVNATDRFDNSILYAAVRAEDIKAVKILLMNGADPNINGGSGYISMADDRHHVYGYNYSLFNAAVESGNKKIVNMLLDAGANPQIAGGMNRIDFILAVNARDFEEVKDLIAGGVSPNIIIYNNSTALHHAAWKNDYNLAKLLMDYETDYEICIECRDVYSDTPLHAAAKIGAFEVVKILIDAGADINATSQHGETPLIYAKEEGHAKIVKLLEATGAK